MPERLQELSKKTINVKATALKYLRRRVTSYKRKTQRVEQDNPLSGKGQEQSGHHIELHFVGHVPAPHHAHLPLGKEVVDVQNVAPPVDAAGVVLDFGGLEHRRVQALSGKKRGD